MILFKIIKMEKKKIKVVKTCSEPKLVRDILVFLGFTNFYKLFIKKFSKITVLFI